MTAPGPPLAPARPHAAVDAAAAALSRPVRDYADAQALLLSRVRDDPRPYAARGAIAGRAVSALLERVGRPQDRLRFLHLAGSKGKGSVALMAEQLLRSLGEPTGTFISPHLTRWNERIRVDGAPVDDAGLCSVLEQLRPHIRELDAVSDDLSPSFFDVITAAGLLAFAHGGCATVVLETGLGGRFDATNVVTPVLCAITSIELEHTDKLGDTVDEVAAHKAGIIKPGVPVVTGDLPARAFAVVDEHVRRLHARELRFGRDWHVAHAPGAPGTRQVRYTQHAPASAYGSAFVCPHPAPHMAVNAGLALTLVRAAGFHPDPAVIERCVLPARVQVLAREPWIVVDGAHTSASLAALARSLDAFPASRRRFLVSSTRGKPLRALATLVAGAEQVWVTCADATRSAPAGEVADALRAQLPGAQVTAHDDPARALAGARSGLTRDGLLCVCGSVYLAGRVLAMLAPDGPVAG